MLASFLPLGVSGYILGLLTIAYYFGVFAMAWDLLFGFAGEVNFGPTFLIGTGAYTAGILDNLYQPPIWLCLVAGALAAVAGGVVLALPALRVRGPYFGLTTLVAVLMLQNFIVVDASLTGGEIGLDRARRHLDQRRQELRDRALVHGGERRDPVRAVALAGRPHPAGERTGRRAGRRARLQRRPSTSSRPSSSARSSPASPARMLVFYLGSASVGTLVDITVGVQIIIAAVLGGRRTILGAVLGAIFLIAMSEALRPLGDLSNFVVSAMALVVVLLFPSGFFGLLTRTQGAA